MAWLLGVLVSDGCLAAECDVDKGKDPIVIVDDVRSSRSKG